MNLSTIEVDPAEAEAKLAEYEGVLAKDRMIEDEAIAQAYRAVKRGMPILRLSQAIERGGFFPNGWPRLAIVRADATECWVSDHNDWRNGGFDYVFTDAEHRSSYGALVGEHTVRVHVNDRPKPEGRRTSRAHTLVPVIPPHVRPKRPKLARLHVLWEVEEWANVAPRDPALLRHVRGDLWVVLAMWELTELERLVLGQSS
jgi:hypothetical protein